MDFFYLIHKKVSFSSWKVPSGTSGKLRAVGEGLFTSVGNDQAGIDLQSFPHLKGKLLNYFSFKIVMLA